MTPNCGDGFVNGQPVTFRCPADATSLVTVPGSVVQEAQSTQLCIPTVSCAALVAPTAGVDVSQCAQVLAGGTCAAGCSGGYQNVGSDTTFSCPSGNTDSQAQLTGAMPTCIPLCGSLGALPEADTSNCSAAMLPGATCSVSPLCSAGMLAGGTAVFRCPADATSGTTPQIDQQWLRASASPQVCFAAATCAPLSPRPHADVRPCARVRAGDSCTVHVDCSGAGYVALAATQAEFACPANNADPTAELMGTAPGCTSVCAGLALSYEQM